MGDERDSRLGMKEMRDGFTFDILELSDCASGKVLSKSKGI
jgi:hypothetical protein